MAAQVKDEELGGAKIKFQKEVYEKVWIIQDWVRVQRTEDSLAAQTIIFETGKSKRVQTKWEIGLHHAGSSNKFAVYWKLIGVKGFPVGNLEASVSTTFFDNEDSIGVTEEKSFEIGEKYISPQWMKFERNTHLYSPLNWNSEFKIKLSLTVMEPSVQQSVQIRLKELHINSVGKVCANFASLVNDKSTADLKIVTSDKKELWAHKIILKAQCPVFDSMFRSIMSENQTGIVGVEDLTGKTMGIFLHYFYTGELLPSWKDDDTVVEFTYAAGKYQLTEVLQFLDDVLGTRDEEDATQTDVLLIDLAAKLGFKNAEKDLLDRIVEKTNNVKSRDELFGLYPIDH